MRPGTSVEEAARVLLNISGNAIHWAFIAASFLCLATTPVIASEYIFEKELSNFSQSGSMSDDPANTSDYNYVNSNNSSRISEDAVHATLVKLPLTFIENRGHSSDDVKFMAKTQKQTVFFTPSEVIFALSDGNNSSVVLLTLEGAGPAQIMGED